MGCTQSNTSPPSSSSPSSGPSGEVEQPKPQIFALMRNGHEVIRGDSRDVKERLEAGDVVGAKELWENMRKWEDLHARTEEGTSNGSTTPKGFFHILNEKFDGLATSEGLLDAHEQLEKKSQIVEKMFEDGSEGDMTKILSAYEEFAQFNEGHLKKEETIMMPKVMEMKKQGQPLKKIMMEEILAAIEDSEEAFFISHACKTLEKHHEGMPRARVFCHALWAASTESQWNSRKEIVKGAISVGLWNEIDGLTNFN